MAVPTMPDRMMVFQYIVMSLRRGHTRSIFVGAMLHHGVTHHGDDLREPERADHGGDELDAARDLDAAEAEPGEGPPSLHADHRDQQADEARDPALQGSFGAVRLPQMMIPKIANQNISKLLNSSACLPSHGVKDGHDDHADDGPEERAGRGDADGPSRQALLGQRVAVHAGGRVGRGAGDVQQYRAAAAAVDGADVHADQGDDRIVGFHLKSKRGQQRDAHRRREAGEHADDDARARCSTPRRGECPTSGSPHRASHNMRSPSMTAS